MALGTSQLTANAVARRPGLDGAAAAPARPADRLDGAELAGRHRRVRRSQRRPPGRLRALLRRPGAVIVVGRDRSRTLVVIPDEVPVAQELGDADARAPLRRARLRPQPQPAAAAGGRGRRRAASSGPRAGSASATRSAAWPSCCARTSTPSRWTRARRCTGSGSSRTRTSWSRCCTATSCPGWGSATVGEMAQQPGITEIELFSAALAAAQNANGAPIEFLTDMLSGPLTSKVCCPDPRGQPPRGAGRRRGGRRHRPGSPRLLRRHRRDARRGLERGGRRAARARCSRSSPRPAPSWCPATPARRSSTP